MKFLSENHLTPDNNILEYSARLKKIVEGADYSSPEASLNLPSDKNILQEVELMVQKKVTSDLKYIIDIGIGGSNLGTKAVYDAKYGHFDLISPNRFPKVLFADTNDPEYTHLLMEFLKQNIKNIKEILLVMVSKSGGTTETAENFEIIYSHLARHFPDIAARIVVITDEGSRLWNIANERNIDELSIPKNVGGRYSVMSAVGLFPLLAAGINIKELLEGAKEFRDKCLADKIEDNPALASATILFENYKKGYVINDNFMFHPELESLGKWYRQLMAESIGKEKDLDGHTVNVGITPTVSIGSTDLHSMGQLYLGGPKNKVTTFVVASQNKSPEKTSAKPFFSGIVDNIAGKTTGQIMAAIYEGVKIAYKKHGLPFMEIVLSDLNEKSLGKYMQFKMIEIMYLGRLLNVNAFDQPNVESYKIETKKILNS